MIVSLMNGQHTFNYYGNYLVGVLFQLALLQLFHEHSYGNVLIIDHAPHAFPRFFSKSPSSTFTSSSSLLPSLITLDPRVSFHFP
jgi:hypothetical protein